jgi:hypothetical protein
MPVKGSYPNVPLAADLLLYGERQITKIEDGFAVLNSPLMLSVPPHEANHTFATGVGEG